MTNEELQKKLTSIKNKLEKAHKKGDENKINYYTKELNILWREAADEMLKNAKKDGLAFD
tara:strand:- start:1877 stop:2056 length:180 start_codon:yes stop_codon:yes gene_type:complete